MASSNDNNNVENDSDSHKVPFTSVCISYINDELSIGENIVSATINDNFVNSIDLNYTQAAVNDNESDSISMKDTSINLGHITYLALRTLAGLPLIPEPPSILEIISTPHLIIMKSTFQGIIVIQVHLSSLRAPNRITKLKMMMPSSIMSL